MKRWKEEWKDERKNEKMKGRIKRWKKEWRDERKNDEMKGGKEKWRDERKKLNMKGEGLNESLRQILMVYTGIYEGGCMRLKDRFNLEL